MMEAPTQRELEETFSEKRKRGRPRLLSEHYEEFTRRLVGKSYHLRTVHNREYEGRAMSVLGLLDTASENPYKWLFDPSKQEQYGVTNRRSHRQTILAALGRIDDDTYLRLVAREICELKPKTQDAIAKIRSYRLGRAAKIPSLREVILETVAKYRSKYPRASVRKMLEALEEVNQQLQDELDN